jgi:hypothetical protein
MGKINFFLSTLPFSPWVVLATWLHVGAPYKLQETMNLMPVLNKTSPRAHTKLELDVLGAPRMLMKYIAHSFKRKN